MKVRCTVEDMNYSACDLQVGDYFELTPTGVTVPEGKRFCYFAIAAVIPAVLGRLDTDTPDSFLQTRPLLACPDPPENLHLRVEPVTEETP